MFWKKIAKIVLYVNVVFGLIASIASGKAVGNAIEELTGSGGGMGFLIFLMGIVITLVGSCVLGTICEIADAVEGGAGGNAGSTTAIDRELKKHLTSIENTVERLVVAAKGSNGGNANKTVSASASENIVSAPASETDVQVDLDQEISVNGKETVDLDATVALPESAFEEMGLELNKNKAEQDELKRREPVAFCVKCGAKNRPDSAFCFSCGAKLAK